ncbi:MAG: hypothetical protein KKC85_18335, partial [Gammaproteobacteria bacterium]|nr:hypothetical protein [Gammaproteobacteria bacterium]
LAGGAAATAAVPAAGAMGALGSAGAASGDASSGGSSMSYFIDSLFRRDVTAAPTDGAQAAVTPASPPSTDTTTARPASTDTAAMTAEVTRIFVNALRTGSLPQDDGRYVARQVADRTGMSQADAEKRVNDVFAKTQATLKDAEAKARDAADTARKASAYGALWLFISMLIGAFVASLAATYGGHRRDL